MVSLAPTIEFGDPVTINVDETDRVLQGVGVVIHPPIEGRSKIGVRILTIAERHGVEEEEGEEIWLGSREFELYNHDIPVDL